MRPKTDVRFQLDDLDDGSGISLTTSVYHAGTDVLITCEQEIVLGTTAAAFEKKLTSTIYRNIGILPTSTLREPMERPK